jgi:hypothetical protein
MTRVSLKEAVSKRPRFVSSLKEAVFTPLISSVFINSIKKKKKKKKKNKKNTQKKKKIL